MIKLLSFQETDSNNEIGILNAHEILFAAGNKIGYITYNYNTMTNISLRVILHNNSYLRFILCHITIYSNSRLMHNLYNN